MEKPPAAIFDPSQPCSPLTISSDKTALLLMDYAHLTAGIVGERGPHALASAGELRNWALNRGISVYHCSPNLAASGAWPTYAKYTKQLEYIIQVTRDSPMLAEEPAEIALKDSREKAVKRRPGHMSVLHSEGLLDELRAKNVRSLIIAGFTTSGCVLSTVRAATDLDFMITVAEDACGDYVPAVHEALIKHVFPGTAHVATVKEIVDAWKSVET